MPPDVDHDCSFDQPDDAESGEPAAMVEDKTVFVTAKEVAGRFRRTPRTLWNWEQRGVLVPVRIGRNRLYRLTDVDALARSGWR